MIAASASHTAVAEETPRFGTWTVSKLEFDLASSELRAEATAVLANILSKAEVTGFTLVPGEASDYHAAWAAPGLLGGLRIQSLDVGDSTGSIIAAEDKSCDGNFAAARERQDGGISSLLCACKAGDAHATRVFYTVVPRSAGGSYVLFVTAAEGEHSKRQPDEIASKTGGQILKASMQVILKD